MTDRAAPIAALLLESFYQRPSDEVHFHRMFAAVAAVLAPWFERAAAVALLRKSDGAKKAAG